MDYRSNTQHPARLGAVFGLFLASIAAWWQPRCRPAIGPSRAGRAQDAQAECLSALGAAAARAAAVGQPDHAPKRSELGRLLFFDPRMSADGSMSCNSLSLGLGRLGRTHADLLWRAGHQPLAQCPDHSQRRLLRQAQLGRRQKEHRAPELGRLGRRCGRQSGRRPGRRTSGADSRIRRTLQPDLRHRLSQ